MIEVEHVRKSFNGTQALDDVSLRVKKGELVGLVGPNGAGKTTLIRILSTLLLPDRGTVSIDGTDVVRNPASIRRVVGYLADQSGLYQDMRVRELLEFFADAFHLQGAGRNDAIESALVRAGLESRAEDLVEGLSFGAKQRLMLAKTLLHSPSVLLLDEPANGLDPIARVHLRDLLKELNSQGLTILISSHILADLEDICTHAVLISSGRNVVDEEGNVEIALRQLGQKPRLYEVELLGGAENAAAALATMPGVRVLEAAATRLRLSIEGPDERIADTLRTLVTAGITVTSFAPRGSGLEQRYRAVFGGNS
jgi:ABC-2 type transport system ATP-binding protein